MDKFAIPYVHADMRDAAPGRVEKDEVSRLHAAMAHRAAGMVLLGGGSR